MFGGMSPPMIQNSIQGGGILVRHREYIGDIAATNVFTNRNFAINPGLTSSFPWLSQIANAFEQYRFRGLIFEFKSTSADALVSGSNSIGQGTVIMATQYNSLSTGFSTKIEMENHEWANSCKPSCSFMHPIECALYQTPNTPLYVRNGAIPPNADERLYDLGNFNLATEGMPVGTDSDDNNTIGELWCTFEIEFFKPKYDPNSAEGLGMDRFQAGPGNTIPDSEGYVNLSFAAPFGDLTQGFYAGNLGCALAYPAGGNGLLIRFPPASTEIGERFWISYTALSNSTFPGSNQSLTATYQGCKASNTMWQSVPMTSPESALAVMDNNTVAANESRKILYQAVVEAIALPANVSERHVLIGNWGLRIPSSIDAIANIFIVKLPSVGTIDPMHSSDLTQFGTDV